MWAGLDSAVAARLWYLVMLHLGLNFCFLGLVPFSCILIVCGRESADGSFSRLISLLLTNLFLHRWHIPYQLQLPLFGLSGMSDFLPLVGYFCVLF